MYNKKIDKTVSYHASQIPSFVEPVVA